MSRNYCPTCGRPSATQPLYPRRDFWEGARLGAVQGNALLAPVCAVVLLGLCLYVNAAICVVVAALSWFIWDRDFDMRWRA